MQGHVVIYIHTEQTKLTYEFHDKAAFQDPSKCHVRIRKGEKENVKKIGRRKKNWVKIPFLMLTKMILCCRVFCFCVLESTFAGKKSSGRRSHKVKNSIKY